MLLVGYLGVAQPAPNGHLKSEDIEVIFLTTVGWNVLRGGWAEKGNGKG